MCQDCRDKETAEKKGSILLSDKQQAQEKLLRAEILVLRKTLQTTEAQQRLHESKCRSIKMTAAETIFGSNRSQRMLAWMEQNYYAVHWRLATKTLYRRIRRLERKLPTLKIGKKGDKKVRETACDAPQEKPIQETVIEAPQEKPISAGSKYHFQTTNWGDTSWSDE